MNKSVIFFSFFFVIYVNKVVLVFVFFYKMDCSRAQVQPNLREGDRPSQRAKPLQDTGASRIRGHVTIPTHILPTSGWWLHQGCGAQLQGTMTCSSGSRDRGLGAARGLRARSCCVLLQGDDADAVFGFFDSPPPPEPVLLPNASHQEVTSC